jgi:hypothetical protein
MRIKRLLAYLWMVGMLVTALVVFAYRQDIRDWWFLRSYQPSAEVASISDRAGFSPQGQRLFYLSDPQVLDKDTFNQSCVFAEFSLVVGCFDGGRIFLLDIENPALEGGELVTAAHEMLHAAYQRLSPREKERLSLYLNDQLDRLTDADLINRVQQYEQSENIDMTNELHSLFGSEIDGLSADLKEYYQRYFLNRSDIVSVAMVYDTAFEELENQASSLLTTIEGMSLALENSGMDLQNRFSYLESEKMAIESLMADEERPSDLQHRIDSYNTAVNLYNRDVGIYQSQLAEHETLVDEYRGIALRYEDLVHSIDSHFIPSGIE